MKILKRVSGVAVAAVALLGSSSALEVADLVTPLTRSYADRHFLSGCAEHLNAKIIVFVALPAGGVGVERLFAFGYRTEIARFKNSL